MFDIVFGRGDGWSCSEINCGSDRVVYVWRRETNRSDMTELDSIKSKRFAASADRDASLRCKDQGETCSSGVLAKGSESCNSIIEIESRRVSNLNNIGTNIFLADVADAGGGCIGIDIRYVDSVADVTLIEDETKCVMTTKDGDVNGSESAKWRWIKLEVDGINREFGGVRHDVVVFDALE